MKTEGREEFFGGGGKTVRINKGGWTGG